MVLLGAGASVPADVPSAEEMTTKFLELAEKAGDYTATAVLRYVIGEIVGRRIQSGTSIDKVRLNIEDVFRAVHMLAWKADIDAAPFISSWDPRVEQTNKLQIHWTSKRDLAQALQIVNENWPYSAENPAPPPETVEYLHQLVHAIQIAGGGGFQYTYEWMLGQLIRLVYIPSHKKAGHYSSFVKEAHRQGVVVATLNYDNAVECVCSQYDVPLSLGLSEWTKTHQLKFATGALKYLKLHGSILWLEEHGDYAPQPANNWAVVDPGFDPRIPTSSVTWPAVIFGHRNKLSAHGPMLLLFGEFRAQLFRSDHLIVIGYSFRDEHVNSLIYQWLSSKSSRTVKVYDLNVENVLLSLPPELRWAHESGRIEAEKKGSAEALPDSLDS